MTIEAQALPVSSNVIPTRENHMKDHIIIDQEGRCVCEDPPTGWTVFDEKMCERTTRYTKQEAEKYISNLERNHLIGLSIKKIA